MTSRRGHLNVGVRGPPPLRKTILEEQLCQLQEASRPDGFRISPRVTTPELLWATRASARSPSR